MFDFSSLAGTELDGTYRCGACLASTDELGVLSGVDGRCDEPLTLEVVSRNPTACLIDGPRDAALRALGHPRIATPLDAGSTVSGLITGETATEVTIAVGTESQRLRTSDIASRKPVQVSSMPEGLLSNLSVQQIADLLEFLSTLK